MKYWTYMKGEVPGSYEPADLVALPGFAMTTLVCPGEGEIAEKNWRRAGEFEDIIAAYELRAAKVPPPAPLGAPPTGNEIDALLDTASTRLFSHVADLMKELENRRDEKSLVVSLQRQISALKVELATARERVTMLEISLPRLGELEEAQKKHAATVEFLQSTLAARDAALNEARIGFEKMRGDLDAGKRRVTEAENDLAIRNRLVDKLSHDLSDKELSLAKALGMIRRMEEDLNRLIPASAQSAEPAPAPVQKPVARPPKAEPPPLPAAPETAEPVAQQVLSVPEFKTPVSAPEQNAAFTSDDPPPPPPYLEPHAPAAEMPKAQEALMGFFRKVFPGQSH